jgi:hypothetical protein
MLQEVRSPCGLSNSLSTLRASRSAFVPLPGLLWDLLPCHYASVAPGSSGPEDTSCSHARLGTDGWLTLVGYGLHADILVNTSLYKRRQASLAYQRTPLCEVASVSQRDGGRFARHDTLASDAGNLPLDETKKTFKGQGRSSARSIKGAVVCCL